MEAKQTDSKRAQYIQRLNQLIEAARKEAYKKLSTMSDEDFLAEWLDKITPIFELDNINATVQKTMLSKGITEDSYRYGSIIRATYQAYTLKAIAYFQAFLIVDEDNQKKEKTL